MTDDQLRQEFGRLYEKIEEVENEAASKGHFCIIILLLLIAFKIGAC